jgi:hypothetical protein
VPFPSPPWQLRARAWVSVFAVRSAGREGGAGPGTGRSAGLHAAAFVDYQAGGVLAYHELLVARVVRHGRHPAVRITDIWVDSAASLAGGRSLWAIPKQAARLGLDVDGSTASVTVSAEEPVARARFVTGPAPLRVPFATSTSQVRQDGRLVVTPFSGSGRPGPCRAAWHFEPQGPLGFLAGCRPVASFHLREARLRFG